MAAEPDGTEQAVTLAVLAEKIDNMANDVKEVKGQNSGFFAAIAGLQTKSEAHEIRIGNVEKWQDNADREKLQRRGLILQGWQAFAPLILGIGGMIVGLYETILKAHGG